MLGHILSPKMLGHARQHSAMNCAKMAKSIKIPFGLWNQVGHRKHVLHGGKLVQPDEYN